MKIKIKIYIIVGLDPMNLKLKISIKNVFWSPKIISVENGQISFVSNFILDYYLWLLNVESSTNYSDGQFGFCM